MIFEITFALTVLCIVVAFTFARWHVTGRPVRDLWVFFLVMALSFIWLAYTDVSRWLGDPSLASGQWRALVHRFSIGAAGAWVIGRNWKWR